MKRFYISSIGASGSKVEYSSVTFNSGVNILHGPSNSGKSYVISCINFMFAGRDVPFTFASTGYDTIHMTMRSLDGFTVQMKRRIVEGTKGETGDNTIEVISDYPEVKTGSYSISRNEYSDLLLRLLGITEPVKIITTQDFKVQNLTIRSILHSFFIDEDNIYEKIPAFDVPRHSRITAGLTALNYFFVVKI